MSFHPSKFEWCFLSLSRSNYQSWVLQTEDLPTSQFRYFYWLNHCVELINTAQDSIYIFFPQFCASKITTLHFPTCVLSSPSSIFCLPVLMFSAAALHCHLPFIFFAEASVKHFEIGYWKYPVQQIPILLWQGHGGILVLVIDCFNSCIKVLTASSCSKFHLHSFPINKSKYNVQAVVENPDTCFLPSSH